MATRTVQVGDALPSLERTITLPMMVAYAGATWDWHRYHYDLAYAQAMGQPGPFVDGQMWGGLLAKLVLDWAGADAMLRSLRMRYRAMVYPGDRIVCRGRVVAVRAQEGRTVITCELSITTSDGRAVIEGASADVELP